jgi:hypothetical protein
MPNVILTERATFAIENSKDPLRKKLLSVLEGLRANQPLHPKAHPMDTRPSIWVVRVDPSTRLLFTRERDTVKVLDILDRSEYVR